MGIKQIIIRRFIIVYVLVYVLAGWVTFQFVKLKIVDGAEYVRNVRQITEKDITIEATRGDILAVDGRKLACSVPSYRIYMDLNAQGLTDQVFNANVDALSQKLAAFFRDSPASVYKTRLRRARMQGNQYYLVNPRRISYTELQKVKEFPIFNLGPNKGGFIPEQNHHRKLPFGLLASRTIGKLYLDKQQGGMVGIEHAYDEALRGEDGISNLMRLSNKWIRYEQVPPEDGKSVVSTIDIDIQDVAEYSLMKQLKKHNAHHGVAILMEVETGAVRAIVNLHRNAQNQYIEDHYNYAIGEVSEPGSTFKLASMIAVLEDGLVDLDDTINTFKGAYRYYDRIMRDSKQGGHGVITVRDAFEVSSNIAISRIIDRAYGKQPHRFLDRLKSMGLADSLGIEIKGEGFPVVKDPSDKTWSGITLPWMSIGYEVMMTPLHMLTFYNAIANNGKMVRPRFVEGLMEHESMVSRNDPYVLNSSICSHGTIRKVKELLKGVVENGTAKNIKGTPYGIAGKTGTAQIAPGVGGYKYQGNVKYLASFAGYFPADDPVYSCIVVVTGPSNNVYYGNEVAGSVFKDIADRVYAAGYNNPDMKISHQIPDSKKLPQTKGGKKDELERVLRDLDFDIENRKVNTQWVSAKAGAEAVQFKAKHFPDGIVPDVRGMGAKDAVIILDAAGLNVVISGVGRVVQQSIVAGQPYRKGATIYLRLG